MVKSKLRLVAGGLLLALVSSRAMAWGSKEHMLLTHLAALRVIADPTAPPAMKEWLKSIDPDLGTLESQKQFFLTGHVGITRKDAKGLTLWAIQPDNRSGDKTTLIEPFGVPERLMHFTDMEYLNADVDKQTYHHDLSDAPDISKAPRDMNDPRWKKAGMLPFAVEHSYQELVKAFKAGKLNTDPAHPDDEDTALKWTGYLAHYLEDNTQPLHGTEDYQSQSYFANRRTAPNVHSEMEYKMNDDEKELHPKMRAEYWDLLMQQLKTLKDPVADEKDLWLATLKVSSESYRNLPLIGLAAMNASGQQGTPEKPVGKAGPVDTEKFFRYAADLNGRHESVMQMKARQQAWAVVRVAATWRRAWDEGHAKS